MQKTTTPLDRRRYRRGAAFVAAYLASVVLAAWLVVNVGTVPVGFAQRAPAAACVVGITMVLRDLAQDQLGPRYTYAAMLVATGLSALLSPAVALASGLAFLVSETLDMLVYSPIRRSGRLIPAILLSNTIGLAVDSLIFLSIAFGSLTFFWGQVLAKIYGTLFAVIVLRFAYRHRTDRRPAYIVARELRAQ